MDEVIQKVNIYFIFIWALHKYNTLYYYYKYLYIHVSQNDRCIILQLRNNQTRSRLLLSYFPLAVIGIERLNVFPVSQDSRLPRRVFAISLMAVYVPLSGNACRKSRPSSKLAVNNGSSGTEPTQTHAFSIFIQSWETYIFTYKSLYIHTLYMILMACFFRWCAALVRSSSGKNWNNTS